MSEVLERLSAAEVDEYGEVVRQIKRLEERREALKERIVGQGWGVFDGNSWRVSARVSERVVVDWKAVAEKLGPSHQLIAAHTKRIEVSTVRTEVL
jgi:hypothetical protein